MGEILSALPRREDERLLVGYDGADDGAVYRIDGSRCVIQTVDFFTPIVDDPRMFGAIAAANALSDVYAMGGTPLTALSLVCYPYKTWPKEMLQAILEGGADTVQEAGALVVGGHSVQDAEIKFGYAVTGLVDEPNIFRNNTPEVGDHLVLSKPLGTGTLTTAVKQDKLPYDHLTTAIQEMARLNRVAAEKAAHYGAHAVTDITGFGLMGHLFEMVRERQYGAVIRCESLPVLPHVSEALALKALTGAHKTNRHYVADYEQAQTAALARFGDVVFDPQTSGGLLIALERDAAAALAKDLSDGGHHAAVIGEITAQASLDCR